MTSFTVALLLCVPMLGISADDAVSELYTCSFAGHTPSGDLSGRCTTQSLPSPEYVARWAFTLSFDSQSTIVAATLEPDMFYDLVRGQCLEDGRFTNIMPLWGDFVIKPDASDYVDGLRACTPLYQVAPNKITLTRVSSDPLVLQFLYEERSEDINRETGVPSMDWIAHYLDSFWRLQQNVRASPKVGKLDDHVRESEASGKSHSSEGSSRARERAALARRFQGERSSWVPAPI